ncbi:MAG: enduracididine biosynthesis enzyme MppR [Pseudonocardia sp.]|nr:enduracididine biosynthesis enzyme MppR [Pseudonocardia sp.]
MSIPDTQGRTGPHGYSLPLSPSGTSAMLTAPPWHFSGDVVMVNYRVDPVSAERFLPPELTLGTDPGAAAAVFVQWQWCSADRAELDNPARNQFSEFLLLLSCQAGELSFARCPYAWVDQPIPLMRGWVQGMPKQFGQIHQSRRAEIGLGGPMLGPGGRFVGSLSMHGRRVAEAAVIARRAAHAPPALHTLPLVHTLHSPAWLPGAHPTARLAVAQVTDISYSQVWSGDAELRLFDALDDDFGSLAPIEVGEGYVFSYAETLIGGQALRTSGEQAS